MKLLITSVISLLATCFFAFADREVRLTWEHDKVRTSYYVIRKWVPAPPDPVTSVVDKTKGTWVDMARTVGTETTVTISAFPDTETMIHCVAIASSELDPLLFTDTTVSPVEGQPSNALIIPVPPNSPSTLSAKLIFTPTP